MPRRVSRRYAVMAIVAAPAALLVACGQPEGPPRPVDSQPSATRPAPAAAATPGMGTTPVPPKPGNTTAATPVWGAGQATTTAPAGKKDLVIATAADISKLDPHMSTTSQDIA